MPKIGIFFASNPNLNTHSCNLSRPSSVNRFRYKCLYSNVDGISNKVGELNALLSDEKPDFVFLTETKVNSDTLSSNIFDTSRFSVFRKDRVNQLGPGGGVTILVNKNFLCSEVSILDTHGAEETLWCEVKCSGISLVMGVVYRAPSSAIDNNQRICDIIKVAEDYSRNKYILVCGDFNFGNIVWEENRVISSSSNVGEANSFLESVNDCFWHQHVDDWTHLRDTDQPSRLDLVFTKNGNDIENLRYLSPLGKSKHSVLAFDFITDSDINVGAGELPRKNFLKADVDRLKEFFTDEEFASKFLNKPFREKWKIFKEIYDKAVELFVPVYIPGPKSNSKPKWLTSPVIAKIRSKEKAWRRYRARKTPRRRQEYIRARNIATAAVRRAKYEYEKKVALDAKTDCKRFWSYTRSKTKVKEEVKRVRKEDGNLTIDDKESAEVLNSAFNKVFVRETENEELPSIDRNYNGTVISSIRLSREKLLKNLKVNKACGPDGISPFILNKCADVLCDPILDIFRSSLDGAELSNDWRLQNISAIFKKGSRYDPLNYRPVALTSVVVKLLESLIRDELVEHLERNGIIVSAQHGFRSKRSCLTNLLEYLEDITSLYDEGYPVDVQYLDCEKAFDKVPHRRLLKKLESVGIRGDLLKWIEGFLSNRQHRVCIRGSVSSWKPVHSGVPQGSVLGPLLFVIYINDLVEDLECEASLFADDAKIYRAIRTADDAEALRRDMKRLEEWSNKWLLTFNANKCKTMHIGFNNMRYDYMLNDRILDKTEAEKDLGILISSNLKPSAHVAAIAAKANSRLGIIKRAFEFMDKEMFLSLYLALVRPLLEYAVQSWSPYFQRDIDVIERVQRRATKLVPEIAHLPYESRCRELKIQSLKDRRIRGDMIEVYRILKGYENIDYRKFFSLNDRMSRGHPLKLRYPDHWRSQLRANFFSIRVISPWNALPSKVVEAPTVAAFKSRYDQYVGLDSRPTGLDS